MAVLVAFGVLIFVFMPEELEGDMRPRELLTDVIEGGHVPLFNIEGYARREKEVLQSGVICVIGKGPG
jgi:hypothetical protein